MAEKLTAESAWDALDTTAAGNDLFRELKRAEADEVKRWFAWLQDRIAADVRDEINPQLEKARRERDEARAELKRLRLLSAPAPPKPRRTGGEKLYRSLATEFKWRTQWREIATRTKDSYERVAKSRGIPDDPEPPSDGELMRQASDATPGTADYWGEMAERFLRLRAERDGGEA